VTSPKLPPDRVGAPGQEAHHLDRPARSPRRTKLLAAGTSTAGARDAPQRTRLATAAARITKLSGRITRIPGHITGIPARITGIPGRIATNLRHITSVEI